MGSGEGKKRVAQEASADTAKIAAKRSIPSCSLLAFLQPGIWLGGGRPGWGALVKASLFQVAFLRHYACFHWKEDLHLFSAQEVRIQHQITFLILKLSRAFSVYYLEINCLQMGRYWNRELE